MELTVEGPDGRALCAALAGRAELGGTPDVLRVDGVDQALAGGASPVVVYERTAPSTPA